MLIYGLLNKPAWWRSRANKLKHCADLLFKAFVETRKLSPEEQSMTRDSEIADVATLLYGMAMENVLKAALLKDGIAKVGPNSKICWNAEGAKDHDLLGMCRSLKSFGLTAGQENLMERLSAFVCWAGKYPTPLDIKRKKNFQGFLLANQPNAARVTLPVAFGCEDKDMFDEIFEALNQRN